MPITTPAVGSKITAAWGTSVANALNGVVAQLRQTTAQSIPNTTFTALAWQVADYDTNSGLSAGIWTCPVTGIYRLSGAVEFTANATGRRLGKFQVNGADVNGSQRELGAFTTGSAISNSLVIPPVRVPVSSGQTVHLLAFQGSTAALNTVVTAPNQSYLLIEQVG